MASNKHDSNNFAISEFTLDNFLPYQVAVLAENMNHSFSRVYSDRFGITISEWRVLAQLNHRSPLSAQEVGKLTNMDKPRVSRALVKLSKSKLVIRKENREDRRVAVLKLSKKGKKLMQDIIPHAIEWQNNLENLVSKNAINDLSKLCKTFRISFKKNLNDFSQQL